MCGIIFAASRADQINLSETALSTLKARGPDSLVRHERTIRIPTAAGAENNLWHLAFVASVLSLRGDEVQVQPVVDEATGSLLCWNGEAWHIAGEPVLSNDSRMVLALLVDALASHDSVDPGNSEARSDVIASTLAKITGPYAFVFFDAQAGRVYYGRDGLGRRSLMLSISSPANDTNSSEIIISSLDTMTDNAATEVCANDLHFLDLNYESPAPKLLSRHDTHLRVNKSTPQLNDEINASPSQAAIEGLHLHLLASIRSRVLRIPTYNKISSTDLLPSRVAILFSGGLDCTLLARLCHDILSLDQPVDLINVAFENPRSIRAAASHRLNTTASSQEQSHFERCPDRITGRASFAELSTVCPNRTWRFVAVDVPYSELQEHRTTIIHLMRPHNTEMDLSIAMALYFAARGQGRAVTNDALQTVTPKRGHSESYQTPARVLLSGLGADELFGGYSRHAAAFARNGFSSLIEELDLDFTRIGTRNLGRDDRVMANWSREVRYPFLDESFVQYALDLPVWQKIGFRVEEPVSKHLEDAKDGHSVAETMETLDPTKMILRCLIWKLGMRRVAQEKKRAIQFGARTAKMEVGRTKGTDILS